MASRADRLKVVLELAQKAEDEAADIFNKARKQLTGEQQRLEDLCTYYNDYQQSLAAASGLQTVDAIVRSRGFLQQLAQAKSQQQQIVAQYAKLSDQKKRAWHKAHLKHRALKDLIMRLKADEAQVLSRKEEKLLDEWVGSGIARRMAEQRHHT